MSRPNDDYSSEPPRPRRDNYDPYDQYDRDDRRREDYDYEDDRRSRRDPYDDRDYGRRRYRGSPLASRGARLAAHIIDGFFYLLAATPGIALMIIMGINSTARFGPDFEEMLPGILLLILGLVGLGIYNIVLLSNRGQTLGKKAMGFAS